MHRQLSRASERACFVVAAALFALAAIGCQAVGQPIVDHVTPTNIPGVDPLPCAKPPRCDVEPVAVDAGTPLPSGELSLIACGGDLLPTCVDPDPDADGGTPSDEPACLEPLEIDVGTLAQSEHECERIHIVDTQKPAATSAVIEGLILRNSNVHITRDEPLDITLEGATLKNVFIQVDGPVTLRIRNSVQLEDVRLSGGATSRVSSIELERVMATNLVLGSRAQPFAGRAIMKRSQLANAQLMADDLTLESVEIMRGSIDASSLYASDTRLELVVMVTKLAVLAASWLQQVDIPSCGSLALLEGQTINCSISPCSDEPLRVYGGVVTGGFVDGQLQSDGVSWGGVTFGHRQPTNITAWLGSFARVNFCPLSESLVLGIHVEVSCTVCDGGLNKPSSVCFVADRVPPKISGQKCEALTEPKACPPPVPIRERPPN